MNKRIHAFVADLHVWNFRSWGGEACQGVNARADRALLVLRESIAIAHAAGVTDFTILGDVFDRSNPTPQLVAALAAVVAHARKLGVFVHLLVGNHDMVSEEPGDHALAPLAHVEGCRVYDRPAVEGGVLFCPYRKAPVKEWLPAEVYRGAEQGATVLAAHFGLVTKDTPPFLKDAHDAVEAEWLDALLEEHNFAHVFLGNWHAPARSKYATQLGTICPHSFSDTEPGNIGIFESSSADRKLVSAPKSQPKFKTLKHGNAMAADPNTFMRVTDVPREDLREVRAWWDKLVEDGKLAGVEVEVASKGDGLVAHEVVLPTLDRRALVDAYLKRSFGNETSETMAALKARLEGYGVIG